jgi:serine/threonine protein kinase
MELPERTSNLLRIPIPFPIVKEAGNGGYAIVFEVRDPQTGKKYALKKVGFC